MQQRRLTIHPILNDQTKSRRSMGLSLTSGRSDSSRDCLGIAGDRTTKHSKHDSWLHRRAT